MVDSRIASGRDGVWKASGIRPEIRSRAERNCALPLFLHLHTNGITAHRPIGTGRRRTRRRFGYWGEQIGHLRDRSGHHFGARRQNSSLQPSVGVETAMENVESTGRPATESLEHQGRGFETFPATNAQMRNAAHNSPVASDSW